MDETTKTTTTPITIKEEQAKELKRLDRIANSATVPVQVIAKNSKDGVAAKRPVPLNLTLAGKIDATRTPISWLFALMNFTKAEYDEYVKDLDNLTIGERIAINTIDDTLKKDKVAENRVWGLAEGILRNKALAQAPVNINISRDNKISMVMDEIADSLLGSEMIENVADKIVEGEVADDNSNQDK